MQARFSRRLGLSPALLLITACHGGGPTGPSGPSPAPTPTYSLTATVFYDENANGQLDGNEIVRVPGVVVAVGSASASTAQRTGQALVSGIVEGATSVTVRPESLPWYYQPGAAVQIQVPGTAEVRLPLTLSIGHNNPNIYLGYGDSITKGDGSSDGRGYAPKLAARLNAALGYADVRTWGREGDESWEAAENDVTRRTLNRDHPAYTMILFGTNDWNDQRCQSRPPVECFTIDSLRTVIGQVRDLGSLPVLGTIIPGNPNRVPPGRNSWFDGMNVYIKALALEQNVLLADLNAEFKAQPNLPSLFDDDVHPNDNGYDVLAQGWFKAITRSRSAASSSSRRFGFHLH